jgi:hypothetical protein
MKLPLAFAVLAAASVQGQPATVIPREMAPLRMLQGEWHCPTGWIDFRYQDNNTKMTVRGRAEGANAKWREVMAIWFDSGQVKADYFGVKGPAIHYRLVDSAGRKLVFAEDAAPGQPAHRMTYRGNAYGEGIFYRFELGDKTYDSGVLTRRALIRPLSE